MFEHNKDITSLTTFGIPVKTALFAEYSSIDELRRIFHSQEYKDNEVLHIGGGSNLLFLNDFNGLVLHSAIKGMRTYRKDDDTVFAWAGAGEKWTDFVDWCISQGLGGLENMAGIPGEVGASAVQNVGAYGVEAKDVIHTVRCFDTMTGEIVKLNNKDCGFAYRDSRFKHEWKGRYFVLEVSFRLHPSSEARNLEYGPLKELAGNLGHHPSIEEVAQEVVRIRDSKLPNPAEIGSAGSFFKNPIVGKYFFEEQMKGFCPDIPDYPVYDTDGKEAPHRVKEPAAWL
ncbi:MAG: UDP-N-acetylmuramate dehydrogenase, partial [Muribaculaceae bacterium]|nr:UDP-N-acetylmuramate dehydrogenase [Muribaculaceae bacterium]